MADIVAVCLVDLRVQEAVTASCEIVLALRKVLCATISTSSSATRKSVVLTLVSCRQGKEGSQGIVEVLMAVTRSAEGVVKL